MSHARPALSGTPPPLSGPSPLPSCPSAPSPVCRTKCSAREAFFMACRPLSPAQSRLKHSHAAQKGRRTSQSGRSPSDIGSHAGFTLATHRSQQAAGGSNCVIGGLCAATKGLRPLSPSTPPQPSSPHRAWQGWLQPCPAHPL